MAEARTSELRTQSVNQVIMRPWAAADLDALVHLVNQKEPFPVYMAAASTLSTGTLDSGALPPREMSECSRGSVNQWLAMQEKEVQAMFQYMRSAENEAQVRWTPNSVPVVRHFAICSVKAGAVPAGTPIGAIAVNWTSFRLHRDGNTMSPHACRLSFWLASDYWNLGITKSAVRTLIDKYLFRQYLPRHPKLQIDLRRIEAVVPYFPYSDQVSQDLVERSHVVEWVLEKIGFAREGILRDSLYYDGKEYSQILLAVVRDCMTGY
jgi:RimJ/RimL family protein N-acetyltransferase